MTHQIFQLPKQVLHSGGSIKPGWKVNFYLTGTTTPTPVYTTSALSVAHTQPVVADSGGTMAAIYLDPAITYKASVYDTADVLQYTIDPINDAVLSQAMIGLYLYPRTTAEIAAGITPTLYYYPPLNIRRYGGAPGASDNTPAMNSAAAVCAQQNGGEIVLDTPGEWLMNWVCTTSNVNLLGSGGLGEYDQKCIRPYSTSTAPITFGDGTTVTRYCGIHNCHVSGTNATVGAQTTTTGNAPYAILIKGGVYDFHIDRCVVYNGVQSLAMIPTLSGESISGVTVTRCHFRSDLAGQSTARVIYLARYENSGTSPDLGYLTSVKFALTRINGPKNTGGSTGAPAATGGYLLEAAMLGNVGIVVEVDDCYWDCSDGCGVKITGSSGIVCYDFQLDPGGTGRTILETDQALSDIGRYVVGQIRHGGQKMKFSGGTTIDIPSEADWYTYKHRLHTPFTVGTRYLGVAGDATAYPTSVYWELQSTTGPDALLGADLAVKTAGKGLRVAEGSNAKQGVSTLTSGSVVVSNTSVTSNSRIIVSRQNVSGTAGHLSISRSAGVSFTITSTSGSDASDVAWQIFEPA